MGLWIALAAFAALALPAYASAADGGISGTVTRESTGLPVVNAEVCAEQQGGALEFECTLTEAGGGYEISGLPAGQYVVSFNRGESGLWLVRQFFDGVRRFSEATEVTVSSGLTESGIDAALVDGGAIAGRVTAAKSGAPVEAFVCSWTEADEAFDGCDETASDGSYEIVGVAPGAHELEFWAYESFETQYAHGVPVSVGFRTPGINAALLAGSVSGHVYAAATHQPLAGVSVCGIWAESGEVGGCTKTNGSGSYGFYPVAAGSLKFVFSPEPSEVEFTKGVSSDSWPTQFWSSKPTFAQADTLNVSFTSAFTGIDGLLGPGPVAPSAPPVSPAPLPKPIAKSLVCKKGFVKKRVKGKARCVRKRHHHKRHRRHRHH